MAVERTIMSLSRKAENSVERHYADHLLPLKAAACWKFMTQCVDLMMTAFICTLCMRTIVFNF